MEIIALGDIHMATSSLKTVTGLSSADLVIVTGDITNFGHRSEVKEVLDAILKIKEDILCLAGNLDNSDVNDYLDDLGMNLHGQAHLVRRQVCIYGVGGSNSTPFGTPWEFSEKQLSDIAHESYRQAEELLKLAEPIAGHRIPTILVSHAPPYGTNTDTLLNGKHVGSKAIRRFIESRQPDICLSGHIHEAKGTDTIGKTRIINLGMLYNKGWATLEVEKTTINVHLT